MSLLPKVTVLDPSPKAFAPITISLVSPLLFFALAFFPNKTLFSSVRALNPASTPANKLLFPFNK